LVRSGGYWRYFDLGQDLGTAWRGINFNDSSWPQGQAPLGYGDANGIYPVTTNYWGTNANAKFITTYYRYSFQLTNAAQWTNLWVNLQRDDGAVIYLNEVEIFRSNLPTGVVTAATLATNAASGAAESAWYPANADAALLREGLNVLAAEVHQSGGTSTDLYFNLELKASPVLVPPALTANLTSSEINFEWPSWASGLSLWSTTNLAAPVIWTPVTNAVRTTNGVNLAVPLAEPGKFFQLRAW
jgi:hypothetical protein